MNKPLGRSAFSKRFTGEGPRKHGKVPSAFVCLAAEWGAGGLAFSPRRSARRVPRAGSFPLGAWRSAPSGGTRMRHGECRCRRSRQGALVALLPGGCAACAARSVPLPARRLAAGQECAAAVPALRGSGAASLRGLSRSCAR